MDHITPELKAKAKECLRDCVARDDFNGLQKLKSIYRGVLMPESVQMFIDDQKERWPRLRAQYLESQK